jgi:hypothetical protein
MTRKIQVRFVRLEVLRTVAMKITIFWNASAITMEAAGSLKHD